MKKNRFVIYLEDDLAEIIKALAAKNRLSIAATLKSLLIGILDKEKE